MNDMELAKAKEQIQVLEEMLKKSHDLQLLSFEEMRAWSSLVEVRESTIKGILDSSSNMILTINQLGHINEFNHVAEEKIGLKKTQIVGKSIFEIFPPSPFLDAIKSILNENTKASSKEVYKFETTLTTNHGQSFLADANISKIKIRLDFIYAIYIHDLSIERQTQADLEYIREQATNGSKMASLGEMAAGVAHEINNPLAIIILACKIMKNIIKAPVIDPVMLIENIDTVSTTTDRIAKIVKGLKTFSRQSEIKDLLEVEVNEILSDALNLCRERFKNNGINLTIEGKKHSLIVCNPIGISQVLLNLLNNSFDAVSEMNEKFVKIECEETSSSFIISVTDSGRGISKELQEKIMQPFFTTKDIGKGTGLGLSVSRGIIENHGGTLTYAEKSQHTCFVINLPKKKLG